MRFNFYSLLTLTIFITGLLTFSACAKNPKTIELEPNSNQSPSIQVETSDPAKHSPGFPSDDEKQKVIIWLWKNQLNKYSDPRGFTYPGGTPLYSEMTGKYITRYDYIVKKYPDKPWKTVDLDKESHWDEPINTDNTLDPRAL